MATNAYPMHVWRNFMEFFKSSVSENTMQDGTVWSSKTPTVDHLCRRQFFFRTLPNHLPGVRGRGVNDCYAVHDASLLLPCCAESL
jgi:hypothetical protein